MTNEEWEAKELIRLKAKHRSWLNRKRQSLSYIDLLESDWQGWRHKVGGRVGNHDILWTEAFTVATLSELQDLDELRNEKRLGI